MIEIFDTHTHLNAEQFSDDYDEVVKRAWELYGVKYMNVVGFDEKTIHRAIELSQKYPHVYMTAGWHPVDAIDFQEKIHLPLIEEALKLPKTIAIGETGLDYHWDKSPKDIQHELFSMQLEMAKLYNLPAVIHMRDATEDTVKMIEKHADPRLTGIMHSYSGSPEIAINLTNLKFMISLSGIVTFKNAHKILEVIKETPSQFLLAETDAPYLTPHPNRGKRNEPGYTRYVVEKIAEVREETVETVATYTTDNAKRIFQIEGV
ncbi:MAG: TatD family hydrolase [Culicoidibacterales bacterium]